MFTPAEIAASEPALHWSSEAIPVREQYSSWREACCHHIYAVTSERQVNSRAFRGELDVRRIGSLDVTGVRCEGHVVRRSESDIRRTASNTYYLYYQVGDGTWFSQRERRFRGQRGDLVLADPNVPFSTGAQEDFDFRLFRVPRAVIDRYLANPGHLPMIHLAASSAEAALLSGCLFALWEHGARLDARLAEPAVETLARLMAMTAGVASELTDAARAATRQATLDRALQYIAQHYGSPGLSPASAAKALGVSVRKLHLLVSSSGKSFGERVADRRLEEARLLLLTPGTAERPIADIAFEVGYVDLSTFYRAFRAKWGISPGEARAAWRPQAP